MKILLIAGSVNEKSGWGRHSCAILEHLIAAGAEVEVFSEELSPDFHGTLYPLHLLSSQFPIAAFLGNIFRVRKVAKRFDVVHALDGWPFGVYGYGATLGTAKKFFINGVGTYSIAPLYSFWKGFFLRHAYGKVQKIFCISRYTGEALLEAGVSAEKIVTVHFGVPALPLIPEHEQDIYRKNYSIFAEASPVVLTVGAIKDRKGQMETLKAIEILKRTYPRILYVMAGSSNNKGYIADIKAYAANNGLAEHVRVVEDSNDRELSFLYGACTVFALNSNNDPVHHHFEGFGAVILEACQFGKPSVGSRDCGIEDAIEDGVSGLLTKQRDPADIAEKIGQVIERLDFFSRNAALRYGAFDWKKTVATYMSFYQK